MTVTTGDALVVLPTYNEAENLERVLSALLSAAPQVGVLVVDDGSPDGTGDIADAIAARDGRVHVLHGDGKRGLGAAYRAGFGWGIDRGYDVLVEMDADGSHDPARVPALLDALGDADLAMGSRWVPGGSVVGWPLVRRIISRGGSWYSRFALRLTTRDVTGGFRAYRASALEAIGYRAVVSTGYCFQIEMLARAERGGLRVREIPIEFRDRELGTSKMSTGIVIEAMARVTGWAITGLPDLVAASIREPEADHV